jgi:hypothetical protein
MKARCRWEATDSSERNRKQERVINHFHVLGKYKSVINPEALGAVRDPAIGSAIRSTDR